MRIDDQIQVSAKACYIPEFSEIEISRFAFSYTISIRNNSHRATRLMWRHWIITDANGHVEEVEGEGVVGEQPWILPGETYTYSSGAMLRTPVGCMQGSYIFEDESGGCYQAPIPVFGLALAELLN